MPASNAASSPEADQHTLRLDLGGYLKTHGVTAHRLALKLKGQVPRSTVYSMAKRLRRRINLHAVDLVLDALRQFQGHQVKIDDLIISLPLSEHRARRRAQP